MSKRVQEALTELAALFPENGELLAQTMPAEFLRMVVSEIRELRTGKETLREALRQREEVLAQARGWRSHGNAGVMNESELDHAIRKAFGRAGERLSVLLEGKL